MPIRGIDHLYFETARWDESVAFWKQLGFEVEDEWGAGDYRAARLAGGDARIVLAETGGTPTHSVFFAAPELPDVAGVTEAPHDTHWGTRMMRVTDPDGRSHAIEVHG